MYLVRVDDAWLLTSARTDMLQMAHTSCCCCSTGQVCDLVFDQRPSCEGTIQTASSRLLVTLSNDQGLRVLCEAEATGQRRRTAIHV
jgi:hypothetical protein